VSTERRRWFRIPRGRGPLTWREAALGGGTLLWLVLALGAFGALEQGETGVAGALAVPLIGSGVWLFGHDRRVARVRRERLARLAAMAEAEGWTFREHDARQADRWHVPPMERAGRRRATESVRAQVPGGVVSFVYTWQEHLRATPHPWHVVAADQPAVLPDLLLEPESTASTIADGLGVRDLQVESAAFNREWRIRCADDRYAHALLHPRMLELLMAEPLRGRRIRVAEGAVLTWSPGQTSTDGLATLIRAIGAVADAVPAHLLAEHGAHPRTEAAR
jgi:hypothetical protein